MSLNKTWLDTWKHSDSPPPSGLSPALMLVSNVAIGTQLHTILLYSPFSLLHESKIADSFLQAA